MDESSDFQEKKKTFTGPKICSSSKSSKAKVKKQIKRIKGQKDIRTVLKPKKNDLIAYSKEFDNVCKQSGVDIDPEQLQLAIALSNSLQETNKDSITQSSVSNSQSRIGNIRTTLQQYGFKVPETKKNAITGSRGKKHRKNYKLLTITDSERSQIIADKYAQVLIQNLEKTKHFEGDTELDFAKLRLIDIATNIPYKYLRNNDIFYVNDLVEKSSSNGSLLRDWSNIPGRPVSPAKTLTEDNNMNITEIECSQEELDVVLSGTIKCSERIFKGKKKSHISNESDEKKYLSVDKIATRSVESPVISNVIIDIENTNDVEMINEDKLLTQYRSCSPDIFDDEASVVDKTDIVVVNDYRSDMKSQDFKPSGDVMDLTECVDIRTQNSTKPCSQLSQKCDVTKRKSNDFMEITECVATVSQPILENPNGIDLTQSSKHDNDYAIKDKDIGIESLDLTQSSDSSVDLPFVQIDHKQADASCDDTIILNENEYLGMNIDTANKENNIKMVDLTQEEKPTSHSTDSFIEEYVHEHSSEHLATTSNEDSAHKSSKNVDIDLTQSTDSSADTNEDEPLNIVTHKTYESDNRYDISIDYDDIFDKVCESAAQVSKTSSKYTMRSSDTSVYNLSTNEGIPQKPSDVLSSSQNSEIFEISDGELDYSLHKSRLELETQVGNFDISGICVRDDNTNTRYSVGTNNMSVNDSLPVVEIRKPLIDERSNRDNEITPVKQLNNGDYIVKTDGVTPMPDYESMSSPERKKELDKYGLKPFKRKRAINLLTHLYNQTHPLAEPCPNEHHSPSKKLKSAFKQSNTSPKTLRSPVKDPKHKTPKNLNTIFGSSKECAKENECTYQQTCSPTIKEVYCDEADWVFQRREKAKVHSCRVPLHIAFHNYVSSRRELREAILRYEPINIDVVHKDLIHCGYRYDPKELLKFLDKRCITVKTTDNNARNNKR